MKRKRFTPEQIIRIIKESEIGIKNVDISLKYGISEQTFYNWKNKKYSGMDVSDALRLKVLEDENRKLKAKRTACRLVNLSRSTNRYRESRKDDQYLRERIKELALKHKRYGSSRLHALLKKEGKVINHKRTQRIYSEEGLALGRKKRKKRMPFLRIPLPEATVPHETWSMDFIHDSCTNGARTLTVKEHQFMLQEQRLNLNLVHISG